MSQLKAEIGALDSDRAESWRERRSSGHVEEFVLEVEQYTLGSSLGEESAIRDQRFQEAKDAEGPAWLQTGDIELPLQDWRQGIHIP